MTTEDKYIVSKELQQFSAFKRIQETNTGKLLTKWMLALLVFALIIVFFPWTQNILARGKITALNPGDRPQTIHTTIPGRIEKWFVNEGQLVKKGDTIVFISEIKAEYFDPELLSRTQHQISAKESSAKSYIEKTNALDNQISALRQNLELNISQAENKVKQAHLKLTSDSIDFKATQTNYNIADKQFKRQEELYQQGLVSLTNLELRELKFQESIAKLISAENKVLIAQNDLINYQIELNSIRSDYADKISKSQSERAGSYSMGFDVDAEVAKLKNQLSNYAIRSGFRFIVAPQDCYINKAVVVGVGETIKEGDPIVGITPANTEMAVEIYVRPVDLPLARLNKKVRIIFDGWPTIIFSGWPNASVGTFGGVVVAIDQNISENGKFRLLVAPDKNDIAWPNLIRMGGGVFGMALLSEVPVWYEIWRQLNGFPPDFYEPNEITSTE